MQKFSSIILILLAAILVSYITTTKFAAPSNSVVQKEETVYDRVMRTGTIRCGYYSWAPFMVKDPNTGTFSGLFYDIFSAAAENLGLKVEWVAEIGLGDFPQALAIGRVDAYCTPLAQVGSRARAVDFTDAVGYFPMFAFVRADDTRFNGDISKLNDPAVTISVMDGEMSAIVAAKIFPKAKTLQLVQNASAADLLNNVVTKKADVTLNETSTLNEFLERNPGTLVVLKGAPPVGVFGGGFPIAQGQEKFRQMLNWSLRELMTTGQLDALYTKNAVATDVILRPMMPYAVPQEGGF